jgi:hypothetical protein
LRTLSIIYIEVFSLIALFPFLDLASPVVVKDDWISRLSFSLIAFFFASSFLICLAISILVFYFTKSSTFMYPPPTLIISLSFIILTRILFWFQMYFPSLIFWTSDVSLCFFKNLENTSSTSIFLLFNLYGWIWSISNISFLNFSYFSSRSFLFYWKILKFSYNSLILFLILKLSSIIL